MLGWQRALLPIPYLGLPLFQGAVIVRILHRSFLCTYMKFCPRDADGIVAYLKKQAGPASAEIKSVEDAGKLIDDKKVFIVGVFSGFSGEEFENFMALAEKLRSDYDFGHTLDAKLLPHGDSPIKVPAVRLFKPFDERFVDSQDFHVGALEKFVEEVSVPIVTVFNKDPSNHPYVVKFFNSNNAKGDADSALDRLWQKKKAEIRQ